MLDKLAEIIGVLPWDRIEGNTIYLELDEVSHGEFTKEVEEKVSAFTAMHESVPDIGPCIRLNFMGRNVLAVVNKDVKEKLPTIYLAFKTKIV